MINKRVENKDYLKNADILAPWLLGKLVCRKTEDKIIKARITETECYMGENDSACHASKGKTKRNEPMYYRGGHLYVYLCYGIHSLINVVSGKENSPEAVLIRGVEGASGPGRVSKLLKIDVSFTGYDLCTGNEVWIEDDGYIAKYKVAKRVGIDYAKEEDKNRLWRYISM